MTKLDMFKDMFKLQDGFNEDVTPNWRKANLDWDTAILVETVENIDSNPWKWWKKGELDLFNARVEVTDIWHFLMSKMMMDNVGESWLDGWSNNLGFKVDEEKIDKNYIISSSKNFIKETLIGKPRSYIKAFFELLASVGWTLEDLYKSYYTKIALNQFRQFNGYKDGTYIKDWNGQEDNVVVYSLAEDVTINEHYNSNLLAKLQNYYEDNVLTTKDNDSDWQDRVQIELDELNVKIKKLEDYIINKMADDLLPSFHQTTNAKQLEAMYHYRQALETKLKF